MDSGKHNTVSHTAMLSLAAATATLVAPRHAAAAVREPGRPAADTGPPVDDPDLVMKANPDRVESIRFPLNAVLDPLRADFTSQAQAEGLVLRVASCPLSIDGDPRHLAKIMRIILVNVLRHSRHGMILIGCHRHGGHLSIEVRETGTGVPRHPLQDIIGNHVLRDTPPQDHDHGPDIGLAEAKRLGDLIGCQVVMRGHPGVGSVFVIKVGRFWEVLQGPHAGERAQPWDGMRWPPPRAAVPEAKACASPNTSDVILVVDPDPDTCEGLRGLVGQWGWQVEGFPSSDAFLSADPAKQPSRRDACVLIDADLRGGLSGLDLLRWLGQSDRRLPAIMMGRGSDIPVAVAAMKAGAMDFLQKPVCGQAALASIGSALEWSRALGQAEARHEIATSSVAGLTPRQNQILALVLAGQPSKIIAASLGISQRTVENHRSAIMRKTGARSLPGLTRLALAASPNAPSWPM
ncbi:LuxR C-terminal-related transcriptional regulator [Roseospirillum parvum]|uniref:Two-component response regulator, FixJ family, consists of REC and HTH domains n=1 Tax=Roseospirillum parvum TaxID=83401 RepID=A0A1G8F5E4_9PROT|nr:LuxR C-terminal-related transcriptional regulator [Roseospirillum parvum]SDH77326.1 Two-component response regulator, FixJ family, consists of REC and HTH domains [Roseospirillum parvum]